MSVEIDDLTTMNKIKDIVLKQLMTLWKEESSRNPMIRAR